MDTTFTKLSIILNIWRSKKRASRHGPATSSAGNSPSYVSSNISVVSIAFVNSALDFVINLLAFSVIFLRSSTKIQAMLNFLESRFIYVNRWKLFKFALYKTLFAFTWSTSKWSHQNENRWESILFLWSCILADSVSYRAAKFGAVNTASFPCCSLSTLATTPSA